MLKKLTVNASFSCEMWHSAGEQYYFNILFHL